VFRCNCVDFFHNQRRLDGTKLTLLLDLRKGDVKKEKNRRFLGLDEDMIVDVLHTVTITIIVIAIIISIQEFLLRSLQSEHRFISKVNKRGKAVR